ncbi:hypothetical protein FKW77_008525 [Venturia effusa]|uniref:Peptidase A1 domain-containing protein n=1 Tax=Venturia effusa TaxID=50376 RepID=A0A517LJC7_9PEZI|nr:hypothetical protein FKW77_008525 [Venturia effusa]
MASTPASGGPDYSQFTECIEIPFSNAEGGTPAIDILVNGKEISKATTSDGKAVGLDTGSTVFALSHDLVPDFPEDKQGLKTGEIGYTSGTTWQGHWFPIKVTFDDKKGNTAIAEVSALVVDREKCGPVHYMGIRFGDVDIASGQLSEKNPLLAIKQINNNTVDNKTFRYGFIMRERSIIIGLTAKNTESFKCTKLPADTHEGRKGFSNEPPASIRLNNEPWMHGTALIDTGVNHMLLYTTQFSGDESVPVGTKVTMKFPDENSESPEYSFRWPAENEERGEEVPESIEVRKSRYADKMWVNTGGNFYSKFDTLFDAEEGYWGFREGTE